MYIIYTIIIIYILYIIIICIKHTYLYNTAYICACTVHIYGSTAGICMKTVNPTYVVHNQSRAIYVTNLNISFFYENDKRAAQVGLELTTYWLMRHVCTYTHKQLLTFVLILSILCVCVCVCVCVSPLSQVDQLLSDIRETQRAFEQFKRRKQNAVSD